MCLFQALLTAAGIRTIHALLILLQFHDKGEEECFETGSLAQLQRKALSAALTSWGNCAHRALGMRWNRVI